MRTLLLGPMALAGAEPARHPLVLGAAPQPDGDVAGPLLPAGMDLGQPFFRH